MTKGRPFGQVVVQDDAAHGGVDDLVLDVLDLGVDHVLVVVDRGEVDQLARVHEADGGEGLHLAVLEGDEHVLHAGEGAALALGALLLLGEVVAAEHDVLRGHRDGLAVGRGQDVVRGQHEHAGLDLRLRAESGTCTAIWSPSKSALKAVQTRGWILMALPSTRMGSKAWMPRRCSVGARFRSTGCSRMTSSRKSQTSGRCCSTISLAALMVVTSPSFSSLRVDEGLEQLQGHLLGQAALVQLQLGADHDDGAARVVHALAQQVLAEAALLALQGVGERLQRPVVGPAQHAAAAAVVEERVHRLLQHALLVAHDDVGRAQLDELLQAVVAVDDAAVQVVQVGGGEAAAVQGHQGPQLGRDDRDDVQDHPLRLVAALAEGLHHLQALGELDLLLDGVLRAHPLAQLDRVLARRPRGAAAP